MQDTVTFHILGASASTVTNIGVNVRLTGTQAVPLSGGVAVVDLPDFEFEGLCGPCTDGFMRFASDTHSGVTVQQALNWVSASFTGSSPQNTFFQGVYDLTGPTVPVLLTFDLDTSVSTAGTSDYSHTGQLSLVLPPGVTYTSDSGVFLAAYAVPEPGSLCLLATGIAVAAAA